MAAQQEDEWEGEACGKTLAMILEGGWRPMSKAWHVELYIELNLLVFFKNLGIFYVLGLRSL